MSQARSTVEWCIGKAERGLTRCRPDHARARAHIAKAEHDLRAMIAFSEGFSDWSASAALYAMYHCLLAILASEGFESRNQTCTFAAVRLFIEEGIGFDERLLDRIVSREPDHTTPSALSIRESLQYGVSLSLEDDAYEELLGLVRLVIDRTKRIVS
jgi:uncharacterized protein (UPF0332 family)